MARRTVQANYFADDKDIYDLLVAARQKLTPQKLVELARRRGLVLSTSDDRDELIEQISVLPFSWRTLNELIAATDTADRAEKISSRLIAGDFSLDEMKETIEVLRDMREPRGETYKVEQFDKALRVTVGYSEIDASRTRLVQRTQRELTLEVELAAVGEVLVRHQDQPRAQEVLREIVVLLASKPNQKIEETKIELSGVREAARRTEFFLRLIHGIQGFKFEDVKAVKASQFHPDPSGQALQVGENGAVDEFDDADSAQLDEIMADEATFIARVKEIALKGDGLLNSSQYGQLTTDGFFVRSVVWTAIDERKAGSRVEFESGFDNPDSGTGFNYAIRGVYGRKGDGDFKKNKVPAEATERTRFLRLLESAAQKAMNDVTVAASPDGSKSAEAGS